MSGQAARDGVVFVEHNDLEVVTRTVAGWEALALGNDFDFAVGADGYAFPEGGFAPPEADHLVVLGPVEESIVGRVKNDEAAATANIRHQGAFSLGRPSRPAGKMSAIEVVDHNVVSAEVRQGWIGGDVDDGEPPGVLENLFDRCRTCSPIVIVDAVDDDGAEWTLSGARWNSCGGKDESQ